MKKILLVDDDATIREIYRQRFARDGYEVETAEDGLVAANVLRTSRPDLVILDLMMPRLSGVDVLRFIRSESGLASTPVVVFTNSFLSELAEAANGLGFQRAIVKAQCPPDELAIIVGEIFSAPATAAAKSPTRSMPTEAISTPQRSPQDGNPASVNPNIRRQFLESAPATMSVLRGLYQEFDQAATPAARGLKLGALYRKAHFVATIAGMAGCHRVALLGGAFEALLFELEQRPDHVTSSAARTLTQTMEFLETLFDDARTMTEEALLQGQVLVVDDDPLSNHLAVAALNRARLKARAADNPLTGLEMLRQTRYDLVLLDVEMPHMNGFDLCRKLRTLPGYAATPVIYVTAHDDFDCRAAGVLSGGDDLIAKPIFPLELALKAVTYLIKSQLS